MDLCRGHGLHSHRLVAATSQVVIDCDARRASWRRVQWICPSASILGINLSSPGNLGLASIHVETIPSHRRLVYRLPGPGLDARAGKLWGIPRLPRRLPESLMLVSIANPRPSSPCGKTKKLTVANQGNSVRHRNAQRGGNPVTQQLVQLVPALHQPMLCFLVQHQLLGFFGHPIYLLAVDVGQPGVGFAVDHQ